MLRKTYNFFLLALLTHIHFFFIRAMHAWLRLRYSWFSAKMSLNVFLAVLIFFQRLTLCFYYKRVLFSNLQSTWDLVVLEYMYSLIWKNIWGSCSWKSTLINKECKNNTSSINISFHILLIVKVKTLSVRMKPVKAKKNVCFQWPDRP